MENAPNFNDPLEYIFSALFESFDERKIKILAILACVKHPLDFDTLATLLHLSEIEKEDLIDDLAEIYYMNILAYEREPDTYSIAGVAATYFRRKKPDVITKTIAYLSQQKLVES